MRSSVLKLLAANIPQSSSHSLHFRPGYSGLIAVFTKHANFPLLSAACTSSDLSTAVRFQQVEVNICCPLSTPFSCSHFITE
jgi:hypothetical protein